MANSAPSDVKIFYGLDGGSPPAPLDITSEVMTLGDLDVVEITEEVRPFGGVFDNNKGIGVGQVPDLTFGGLYSETIDAIFSNRIPEGPNATPRDFTVQMISGSPGKTFTVSTVLKGYKRTNDRGALGKYTVTLAHTGGSAPTET